MFEALRTRRNKPTVDPGWRAPNDLIQEIARLERDLVEARAELAELRHLPEEVRRLKGSLTRDQARTEDLARQLRHARQHLDVCPTALAVAEETAAKRYYDGLGDGK